MVGTQGVLRADRRFALIAGFSLLGSVFAPSASALATSATAAASLTSTSLTASTATVGPRGVVTYDVRVTPAPATGSAITLAVTRASWTGIATSVALDASGRGSVDVDTTNWPTGQYTAIARYAGSPTDSPSESPAVPLEITAPSGPPGPAGDLRSLVAGDSSACATDIAGHLSCWGRLGYLSEAGLPNGQFRSVAVGTYHGCVVDLDGQPQCFGQPNIVPLDPPDGTFKEVAVGAYHSCGIRTDDTIACWAAPQYTDIVQGAPFGTFRELSSGPDGHNCAIDFTDHLACWGNPAKALHTPSGRYAHVSVGAWQTCAIEIGGDLDCWNLGPATKVLDGPFVAVSVGGSTACAIRPDLTVACLGGEPGQPPAAMDGQFDFIALGTQHRCGWYSPAGPVDCWDSPQAGDRGIKPILISPTPPDGAVGTAYEFQLVTSTMLPAPVFNVDAGVLPPGLALGSDGTIVGMPTRTGQWSVRILARNGLAPNVVADLLITVAGPLWAEPVPGAILERNGPARIGWQVSIASVGGAPTVAWTEQDDTRTRVWMKRLDPGTAQWSFVTPGASVEQVDWRSAVEASIGELDGQPIVALERSLLPGGPMELVVMRPTPDLAGWEPIGNQPINLGYNIEGRPSLAVDVGTPWVAWAEGQGAYDQVYVRRLSSDSLSWEDPAPSSPISNPLRDNEDPRMTVVDGIPYVAWMEKPTYSSSVHAVIRVARLSAGQWEDLGGPLVWDASGVRRAFTPSIAVLGSTPYVAWIEGDTVSDDFDVRLAGWDDVARQWVQSGPVNAEPCATFSDCTVDLKVVGTHLYAAYGDELVFVRRLATDESWPAPAAGNINTDPPIGARYPVLADVGGSPFVAYENPLSHLVVKRLIEPDPPPDGDVSPPQGNLHIAGGSAYASTTNVTLSVAASDDGPIATVALSNDAGPWITKPFAPTVTWTLPAGDGPHSVSARWRDAAGNWSGAATDTIVLDTVAPTGSISIASGSSYTTSTTVAVAVPASDARSGVSQMALSNDGTTWTTKRYAASTIWQLPTGDGTKTVWAKWRDGAGNWGTTKTDTIVLDTVGPTGSISVASGSPYATSTTVAVTVPALDSRSGVSTVALSNDGTTWISKPYAAATSWQLLAGDGTKTVWAKWRDGAGNWSTAKTDAIVLDTVAPAAEKPRVSLPTGSLPGGGVLVALGWGGTDATSGVARYELAQSLDGGAFTTVSADPQAQSIAPVLAVSHRYQFRVRAVDRAGNVSAWATGPSFTPTAVAESAAALSYSGTWANVTGVAYLGGAVRRATAAGAAVTYVFSGRSVAWLAARGPSLGRVTVYVDGTSAGTIDLFRSTTANRQVVFSRAWPVVGTHAIRLVNQATVGHPGAVVDGFLTLIGVPLGHVSVAR
jgi:hypothetical protein